MSSDDSSNIFLYPRPGCRSSRFHAVLRSCVAGSRMLALRLQTWCRERLHLGMLHPGERKQCSQGSRDQKSALNCDILHRHLFLLTPKSPDTAIKSTPYALQAIPIHWTTATDKTRHPGVNSTVQWNDHQSVNCPTRIHVRHLPALHNCRPLPVSPERYNAV